MFVENESLTADESFKKLIKEVVKSTQDMSGELRGIYWNGKEVRGVEPGGWGSQAHISVDKDSGTIESAERIATAEDALFAAHYISFLEN